MDQGAQLGFIRSERISAIEVGEPMAAQSAEAVVIERIGIEERSPAGGAEILSSERGGLGKTGGANRDAAYFDQRRRTDAAIVGENERKKLG